MCDVIITAVFVVLVIANAVSLKNLVASVVSRILLKNMLDQELDKVKFGPDGETTRRETAERIGRIRR